jgi:hypothetical protein
MPSFVKEFKSVRIGTVGQLTSADLSLGSPIPTYRVILDRAGDITNSIVYPGSVPGWRTLIRRKKSATSPFSGHVLRINNDRFFAGTFRAVKPKGGLNGRDAWQKAEFRGQNSGFIGVPTSPSAFSYAVHLQKAHALAKQDYASKVLSAQRAFQSLVFAGELREAVQFARRPFMKLRQETGAFLTKTEATLLKTERSIRRRRTQLGSRSVRKELARVASESWLEWSFGAQPLISDAVDAAKAASRVLEYYPPSKVVTGRASVRFACTAVGGSYNFLLGTVHTNIVETAEAEVKITGCVSCGSDSNRGDLTDQFGVNLSSVLPAAWELIPYSFLIDYFTNVGDWLEACTLNKASVLWSETGTSITIKRSLEEIQSQRIGNLGTGWKWDVYAPSLRAGTSVERRLFTRSNSSEQSLVPPLRFEFPFSTKKWMNVGALVGARIRHSGLYRL